MRLLSFLCAVSVLAGMAPAGQLRPLFSFEDYPKEALRNRWQGSVAVDVTVSPAGRVTACRITNSSGHRLLDNRTCDIMIDRARFRPATDRDGNAIEAQISMPPVTWSMP